MKDKTNYKLLLVPIISSIVIAIIMIYDFSKSIDLYQLLEDLVMEPDMSNINIIRVAFFGWIVFPLICSVFSIASYRLKKLSISFSVYLLFALYNILCLILILTKYTELTLRSICILLYCIGIIILEVKTGLGD